MKKRLVEFMDINNLENKKSVNIGENPFKEVTNPDSLGYRVRKGRFV